METMSLSDEKSHPGHPCRGLCPMWEQFVVWIKRRPIFALILLALLVGCVLSAVVWGIFHTRVTRPTELKPVPEPEWNRAEFPLWATEKMISYIRHTAPKKFQDISVPLNETAQGRKDLLAGARI